MKEVFVRCEFCKIEIPPGACRLATYRTVIDGKQYIFCCEGCARRYQKARKKSNR